MNNQWERLASKARVKTDQERKRQEQKNYDAFKLLFPQVKVGLTELLKDNSNFRRTRKKVLKLEERKSMLITKRHSMAHDSSFHRRIATEPIHFQ